ncbi:hypothetical protein ARMGADRAFT_295097 [Armillaria gallica]|uniref:Peptidase C14 caspase domain-containing protein n=1 Tax=Armillaria gallica TaxID=47427 RepID=A0A2H3D6H4_ARMGA|nr:hypothetical protein ARMGADRAFT_295097 [Armillaria gallica]
MHMVQVCAQYPPDAPWPASSYYYDIQTCLAVQEGSTKIDRRRPIPAQERFAGNIQGSKEEVATEIELASNFPRVLPAREAKPNAQNGNGDSDLTSALKSPSRVWAVLIGIDAYGYPTYPLRGCVADALAMKQYLVEDLLVPKERIQSLLGCHDTSPTDVSPIPSRANIVGTLLSLITNPNIERGDPIIIYFAGHGSRYRSSDYYDNEVPDDDKEPDDERSHKYIEALCPTDRDSGESSGTPIPDISDRELNTVLSQLSRTKGHQITVILDCCHAGSLTRTVTSDVRTAPPLKRFLLEEMLRAGEEDLKDLPGYLPGSILAVDWCPDMASHVLVAACRGHEYASSKEVRKAKGMLDSWGGVFTSLLIGTLKSGQLREQATYTDLIKALPRRDLRQYSQTPITRGKRKRTCLWYQDRRR